jgi:hypothetical protein
MPAFENPMAEWRHAYRVLGVPSDASAHAIKSAYRTLMKRWHPDRYSPNTPDQADATRMTALINAAYATAQHAPLRYAASARYAARAAGRRYREDYVPQSPHDPLAGVKLDPDPLRFPRSDRLEFWVRFVCGAFFGGVLSIGVVFLDLTTPVTTAHLTWMALLSLSLIVGFGWGAARQGDKFWHDTLGTWDPF